MTVSILGFISSGLFQEPLHWSFSLYFLSSAPMFVSPTALRTVVIKLSSRLLDLCPGCFPSCSQANFSGPVSPFYPHLQQAFPPGGTSPSSSEGEGSLCWHWSLCRASSPFYTCLLLPILPSLRNQPKCHLLHPRHATTPEPGVINSLTCCIALMAHGSSVWFGKTYISLCKL